MTTTPILSTASDIPPPSNDVVHFRVEIDRSRCSGTEEPIEARLQAMEQAGISISIAELVARANLHFAGSVGNCPDGEEQLRMRLAWETLRGWQMTAVPHATEQSRIVLVVADQPNSRLAATRSEVLAFAVALEVGIRLYEIPYAFWDATPGLQPYDLAAFDAAGDEVRVEARGRIDRTNLRTAIDQVHQKFALANFSRAAGVIFFPRTNNRGREADVMILDPAGKSDKSPNSRYRKLLLHYVPFFEAQGGAVRSFGKRLKELSLASEVDFQAYLQSGDALLSGRLVRKGHSGFDWNGVHYVGTFFKDIAWPEWLTGVKKPGIEGVFFWGLARQVIDALQTGRVRELNFTDHPAEITRRNSVMSIILADMTALIWAPTLQELEQAETVYS